MEINTYEQIASFYLSLDEGRKHELCEAIAEDIYFLDNSLQERVLTILNKADPELADRIRIINDFTT